MNEESIAHNFSKTIHFDLSIIFQNPFSLNLLSARPLYSIYFFEVVIILGITVVRGQTTLHLFFRNNFGLHGGVGALNIYIFEVVIILGKMTPLHFCS